MSFCATCFETILASCPETIVLKAGLSPNTEYYWVLKTKFGKLYQRKVTTDAEGVLIMDTSELPAGMLNPYAGFFTLSIKEGYDYLSTVPIMIGIEQFDCIQLGFSDVVGDEGVNNYIYSSATPALDSVDLSHLKILFNVVGGGEVVVAIEKTADTEASTIDWGDGNVQSVSASSTISATHTYADGLFEAKIYPVSGQTDPAAPMVRRIKTLFVSKTTVVPGQVFISVGNSLSYATYLQTIQLDGFGMVAFPALPQDPDADQVRSVSLRHNQLSSISISTILKDLDAIDWATGYVDLSNNPGSDSLSADGLSAKSSLLGKGWTVNL